MPEILILAAFLFGITSGCLFCYLIRKKEEEYKDIVAFAKNIDENTDTNRLVIYCNGITVILSILAEKRLMKLMIERERSSSMVM